MIEGIEKYYKELADSIVESISEPWSSAWSEAVFFSQHIDFTNEYVRTDGKQQSFALSKLGRNVFMDLRDLFSQAKKPLWCRARFELTVDGKFNMKWGYDDCDEKGFAKFDEDAELEKKRKVWNKDK